MPTTRRLRTRTRRETIDPTHWAILTDTLPPADANPFTALDAESYDVMRLLWEDHRAGILADWIKTRPGTRPAMWWRYDAPRLDSEKLGRWSRTVVAPRMIELRRKLHGDGKPLHEVLAYAPAHHYGIPAWFGDPDTRPSSRRSAPTSSVTAYCCRQSAARLPSRSRIRCASKEVRGGKLTE